MMADGLTNVKGVCQDCFKLKLCYQRGVGSDIRWVCDDCWDDDALNIGDEKNE